MSMPSGARLLVKNYSEFKSQLQGYDAARKKAGDVAARVELFRLKGLLQKDLRAGQIAGQPFAPLRVISRGTRAGRKPLSALAVAIRYHIAKGGDLTTMSVGFTGPQSSASWRRIASATQDGFSVSADAPALGSTLRKMFARIGGDYRKSRGKNIAKYFFLRKATTSLQVPGRKIIDPFWNAHESEAERNITSNFNRKMAGERI